MRNVLRCLLTVVIMLGLGGRMYAADASISVSGTEQNLSGSWDSGTVTISFGDSLGHTFHETVAYGQYSSSASIASAFGAMFSRDFFTSGLCAHAVGSTIYFHLKQDVSFGQVSISNSVSFQLNTSLWPTNFINPPVALVCSPDHLTSGDATSCTASLLASATGSIVFSVDGTNPSAPVTLTSGSATTAPGGLLSSASLGGHIVTAAYYPVGSSFAVSSAFVGVIVNAVPGSLTSGTIYSYNIVNLADSSGYAPNGNITDYRDSVNGYWDGITYDSLNRITGANGPQAFCWVYDSFGNRKLQSQESGPFQSGSPNCLAAEGATPVIVTANYASNNQLTSSSLSAPMNCPSNSVSTTSNGYCYDAAGDVTADGTNYYLYDDEGRACAVEAPPLVPGWPVTMVQYIYDAEGRRVAKGMISTFSCDNSINSSTNLPNNGFTLTNSYALGLGGEQVTETGGDGQWLHTNVFVGGQLLVTYDDAGVHSHITDWLGSRRVQTNYLGQVEATYQNLPFGEMLPQNNSVFLGATEQHFTGKERDTESGNDYFLARYYSSPIARFTSPDDGSDQSPDDPQSWNLYSYVRNSPLVGTDEDGHSVQICDTYGNCGAPISNQQYDMDQKSGSSGLDEPTLRDVGMNGNGAGQFYATPIYDSNGVAGYATYVWDGDPTDIYANWAGLDKTVPASNVVTTMFGYWSALFAPMMPELLLGTAPEVGLGVGGVGLSMRSTGPGPSNLREHMAIQQVKANPGAGTEIPLKGGMQDPYWQGSDGWVKMRQSVNTGSGKPVEVHYVMNTRTGEVADFKISK